MSPEREIRQDKEECQRAGGHQRSVSNLKDADSIFFLQPMICNHCIIYSALEPRASAFHPSCYTSMGPGVRTHPLQIGTRILQCLTSSRPGSQLTVPPT